MIGHSWETHDTVNIRLSIAGIALFFWTNISPAQTLGGVFGPGIQKNDRSWQLRMAYTPDETGKSDIWAGRIHYQHSYSDRLRGRFWVAFNNAETGEFELKFFQAELHWQFKKKSGTSGWASGLRFDYRLTENDDGNDKLGLIWTNQWAPQGNWVGRHAVFAVIETGAQSKSGVALETRSALDYNLENGYKIGVHSFNTFGNSRSLGSFDAQNHRIGPTVSGKLNKNTMFLFGPLFGISDSARDVDVRLWIGRSFDW